MAVQAQQPLVPFRQAAREHIDFVGTIPFVAGQVGRVDLPQVGLVNEVFVIVKGTMTLGTGGGTITPDGPWALVNQLRLFLNTGVDIYRLSGYQAFIESYLRKESFNASQISTFPTAAGANAWTLFFSIPVAINNGLNFSQGLINLATQGLRATVEITWGTLADAVSNATSFVGAAEVWYRYYELPDPRRVAYPRLDVIHRLINDRMAITGTGEQRYLLPEQGQLLQLVHIVRLNGVRNSADVRRLDLVVNKASYLYRVSADVQRWLHQFRYTQALPVGVFVWDLFHAQNDVTQGDARDAIHTEQVATIESVVDISPTATLGAANNFLDSILRITQVAVR